MSRIEAVAAYAIRLPLHLSNGLRTEECFLLRIITEDGLEGWGEAHGSPYLSRAVVNAPVTHVTAQGLRGLLVGQDSTDVTGLRRRMEQGTQWIGRDGVVMQAIAAAELALWDLVGRRASVPTAHLFSQTVRAQMPCYASDKVAATPELTAQRIVREQAAGFGAHKIGWPPFGKSEEGDIRFLEAVRAVAPDSTIMVDAAQAFDEETAKARVLAFRRFDLAWIEEPMERDDLAGQERLKAMSPVPIASGEGECGLPGLMRVVPFIDVLQADITRCGILAAREAARHVPRVCSHSFTTPLNVAMHAHWLAATPNSWLVEWPISKIGIWDPFFTGDTQPQYGMLQLPDQPGWGVVPDLEKLGTYLMPQDG